MEKRVFFSSLIIFAFIIMMVPPGSHGGADGIEVFFGGGNGTYYSPYLIEDRGDFEEMRNYLSAYYRLVNDIDWPVSSSFTPIGTEVSNFSGHIDGDGHRIKGLRIDLETVDDVGLFGVIGEDGTVVDLVLEDCEVNGNHQVGGLVGTSYGSVQDCSVLGKVLGNYSVGGLVGLNMGTVSECTSTCEVSGVSDQIGGLVGRNEGSVQYSSSDATVHGLHHAGGMVGMNFGTVIYSNTKGTVETPISSGGVIGTNYGEAVDCYSTCHVKASRYYAGGLVGLNEGKIVRCNTTATLEGPGLFIGGLAGVNTGTIWQSNFTGEINVSSWYIGGLIGGNTNASIYDCYADATVHGNRNVGVLIGKNYNSEVVGCYASGAVRGEFFVGGLIGCDEKGDIYRCSSVADVEGEYLIGGLLGECREGRVQYSHALCPVDGIDHVGGLVGECEEAYVWNSFYRGNVTAWDLVGGLIGFSKYSDVFASWANGTIDGRDKVGGLIGSCFKGSVGYSNSSCRTRGRDRLGGLIGDNDDCEVRFTFSTGDTTFILNGTYGGGLVGYNYGFVNSSYATGNVTGYTDTTVIGGIVGLNRGEVHRSYSRGRCVGSDIVGGAVGHNRGEMDRCYSRSDVSRESTSDANVFGGFCGSNQGWINYCYSTGSVSYYNGKDPTCCGFIGEVTGFCMMCGNFWDIERSHLSNTSGNASGRTMKEMRMNRTYREVGWNFSSDWGIVENVTYPYLLWQDMSKPWADAGIDITVGLGDIVKFDGTGSYSTEGIEDHRWRFHDGSPIELSGPNPSHQFSYLGRYEVTLTVTGSDGLEDTDRMIVTILDLHPPVARAGEDITIAEGMEVHFDGSDSRDDVAISGYSWTFFDREWITLEGVDPTYRFMNPGIFTVALNVSDTSGHWDVSVIVVTVRDITPPIADAGPDTWTNEGSIFIFNGSASHDNADIANYTWVIKLDGILITLYGLAPEFQFMIPGNYSVVLYVTDTSGHVHNDTMSINVFDLTRPVAIAGENMTVPVGTSIELDGSSSTDNGLVLDHAWSCIDLDDGEVHPGAVVTMIMDRGGIYDFVLTVTDGYGNFDKDILRVTVVDTGVVYGRVLDRNGLPVEGALVEIVSGDGSGFSTITGMNGSFTMTIPWGEFTWNISKDGYIMVNGSSYVGPMNETTLDLSNSPLIKEKEKETPILLFVVPAVILLLLIIALALLQFLRSRRKVEPPSEELSKELDSIDLELLMEGGGGPAEQVLSSIPLVGVDVGTDIPPGSEPVSNPFMENRSFDIDSLLDDEIKPL